MPETIAQARYPTFADAEALDEPRFYMLMNDADTAISKTEVVARAI